MAFLKLRSVTCNDTSGGRIQLKVGPNTLLDYTQIATIDEQLPKTVDFSKQGLFIPFIGTIAIDLYDETILVSSGNSVASSAGITDGIVPSGDRTIAYENSACSGIYIVNYEVDNNFPGTVASLVVTIVNAIVSILVAITAFLGNLTTLIARPFTRLFSNRRNQADRVD